MVNTFVFLIIPKITALAVESLYLDMPKVQKGK
jgi:hypothetical protein